MTAFWHNVITILIQTNRALSFFILKNAFDNGVIKEPLKLGKFCFDDDNSPKEQEERIFLEDIFEPGEEVFKSGVNIDDEFKRGKEEHLKCKIPEENGNW